MNRFFDADNPLMKALSRLVDLVILNFLTILCALPIVTAGASLTSMNYVLMKYISEEETYTKSMFFRFFKENLKQGSKLGVLYVVITIVVAGDMLILHNVNSKGSTTLMIVITVVAAYILSVAVYSFALLARYDNSVKITLLNALKISLTHIPSTIGIILMWLGWAAVLIYLNKVAILAFILYGFTLPGYMCTLIYWRIFKKLEMES